MIECKENFKNKYKNETTCRKCKEKKECQYHIFQECKAIHVNETTKIKKEEIFTEDPIILRDTAKKIEFVLERLAALEPGGTNPRRPP